MTVLKDQVHYAQQINPMDTATLDQDGTLKQTYKSTALHGYKGYKAYQPINTYWFEQDILIHSEFRDGNVPANCQLKHVLEESLEQLPDNVKQVYFRVDSAGYQKALLNDCASGGNQRFGVIYFAVSVYVSEHFKQAVMDVANDDWHNMIDTDAYGNSTVNTHHQWAEVNFAPEWISHKKSNPDYLFIAIREYLHSQDNCNEKKLPFPTYAQQNKTYKLFGIVSNRYDLSGNELIHWHRQRCGRSEDLHKEEKIDLSCQQLPSKYVGAKAAYWLIMILSFNLSHLIQRFMPTNAHHHLNTLRRKLITVPARIIYHGRQLIVKLDTNQIPLYHLFVAIRTQINC